jgi:hypothetical protein
MKCFVLHLESIYGVGVAEGVVSVPVGLEVPDGAGVPVGVGVPVG